MIIVLNAEDAVTALNIVKNVLIVQNVRWNVSNTVLNVVLVQMYRVEDMNIAGTVWNVQIALVMNIASIVVVAENVLQKTLEATGIVVDVITVLTVVKLKDVRSVTIIA